MIESTLTMKGQTTVPARVREAVGAKPGTRLVWHVMPDGSVLIRAKSRSVLELGGMLSSAVAERVDVKDMNAWSD